MSILRHAGLAVLLASTWLVAGCQRASSAADCPKECTCSGAFRFCGHSPEEVKAAVAADAALARIPALKLPKLGSIRYADSKYPNHVPIDRTSGFSTDDRGFLAGMSAIGVDVNGRIYVIDASTHSEHVFDDNGRQLLVGPPAALYPAPSKYVSTIQVASSGDAWVLRGKPRNGRLPGQQLEYVHYGPAAQAIGVESIALDGRAVRHWLLQPNGSLRWMFADKMIALADPLGTAQRSNEWPGKDGYGGTLDGGAAVAPDGSLAIVALRPHPDISRGLDSYDFYAALYSPSGEKMTEWPLPFKDEVYPYVAFDGRHLAFTVVVMSSGQEEIVVADAHGHGVFRASVETDARTQKIFLIARATGEELWVYGDGAITRYAMP